MSFCHPCRNPTEKIFARTSFQFRCVSHVKIANVHIGTVHRNKRISLQFSHQFAIFISVYNFHISLQFSPFGVQFLRGRMQFSYGFAISYECNFHISLQFSRHDSPALLMMCGFTWYPCHCDLELINSTSAMVLRKRQRKIRAK